MEKLTIGSDCSGVGALIQAVQRLKLNYKEVFACDFDIYARMTYILNFGTEEDIKLSKSKLHKKYADGVKKISLSNNLPSLKDIELLNDANEFAKLFSFYYPFSMYQREVPKESLELYVSTVPCQAFSLAGKRKGEADKRGILFYNSHEFIQKNKPKYFIFENVKGLLSDDEGKTFQRWIDLLGGKTVNGNPVIFPHEDSTPYHVYYQILNAKHYEVPQNRERIFIIGIRDDADNYFHFPKTIPLKKRLKDCLEKPEDFESLEAYNKYMEKYFLSDEMVSKLIKENGKEFINQDTQASQVHDIEKVFPTLCAGTHGYALGYVKDEIIQLNDPVHSNDRIYSEEGISPTLNTMQGGNRQPFVQVSEPNVINPLKDKTEYGWHFEQNVYDENGITRSLKASDGSGNRLKVIVDEEYKIGAIRGRNPINPINPKSRKSGLETVQMLEINENDVSNALTTVQKDNVVVISRKRIRRLTERECFNLMDFNKGIEDVPDFKWEVSSTQAYKQAGNSIVVNCFVVLLKKLLKL